MRKIAGLLIIVVGLLNTGCASMYCVSKHNMELDRKAVQLRAEPGGAMLAVDLMGLKGWWGLAQENPGAAIGAGVADLATLGAAGFGIYKATSGNKSDGSSGAVQITGNGNSVQYTGRDGNPSNTRTTSTNP
jgi:hypothetical protein